MNIEILAGKNVDGILITKAGDADKVVPSKFKNNFKTKKDIESYFSLVKKKEEILKIMGARQGRAGTRAANPEYNDLAEILNERVNNLTKKIRASFKDNKNLTIAYEFDLPYAVACHVYGYDQRKLPKNKMKRDLKLSKEDNLISFIKAIKKDRQETIAKAREALKVPRKSTKQFGVTTRSGSSFKYTLSAGTHSESGIFLKFLKLKKGEDVLVAKAPKTTEHHVAVEIEFVSRLNRQDLAFEMNLADLGEFCHLKDDGSVRDEDDGKFFPHELVICAPESKIYAVVEAACSTLNKIGAKVNKTCGLHVHLDCRTRDKEIVFSNLVASQSLLYEMQPKQRRENEYCKRVESRSFAQQFGHIRGNRHDRYGGVNALAYDRHRTIEIRMHTGTTNAIKINNWVKLLVSIATKETEIQLPVSTPNELSQLVGLPDGVVSYMESRIAHFKKIAKVENEVSGEAA